MHRAMECWATRLFPEARLLVAGSHAVAAGTGGEQGLGRHSGAADAAGFGAVPGGLQAEEAMAQVAAMPGRERTLDAAKWERYGSRQGC